MKNSNRIEPFLNTFKKYWEKHPELRFGQIVANVIRTYDGRLNCDPFFIEDNDFIKSLEKLDDYTRYIEIK